MRADSPMPLPKSILCAGCKKTYPEGWKRCPYCGHDVLGAKHANIARRYMEKKIREFEQRTGRTRKDGGGAPKEERGRDRGQRREGKRGQQPQKQAG